jgi:hypothetical protein
MSMTRSSGAEVGQPPNAKVIATFENGGPATGPSFRVWGRHDVLDA